MKTPLSRSHTSPVLPQLPPLKVCFGKTVSELWWWAVSIVLEAWLLWLIYFRSFSSQNQTQNTKKYSVAYCVTTSCTQILSFTKKVFSRDVVLMIVMFSWPFAFGSHLLTLSSSYFFVERFSLQISLTGYLSPIEGI